LGAGADTAVTFTGETAELRCAAVKDANAASGHLDIEVVLAEVATGVGGLDDHGLAGHRTGCEAQTNQSLADVLDKYRSDCTTQCPATNTVITNTFLSLR
jgi:hypothetical protein